MLGILRQLLQGDKKQPNPPILNKLNAPAPNFQQAFQSGGLTMGDQQAKQTSRGADQNGIGMGYYRNGYLPSGNNYGQQRSNVFTQPANEYQGQLQHFSEDSLTPSDALFNTGYYSPQVSMHGNFMQQQRVNSQYPELRRILGF